MRKAVGRETAGKEKSRKSAETNRTAGKRSTNPALQKTFDADALLDSMDGMVYVASPDYRIEYMNEAARRKIGRDMTGRHCFKVFHGLKERCPWCMGELVLQGQTVRQEIMGQLDKRWYSNVITPLRREDGSVFIQALVFDITDQKLSQAALVQNEALLRSIHQVAPMGIGVVKSRVLEWTNDQLSRMTGYTAEELRGKSARILYADDEEFDRVGRHKYAEIHRKGTGSIVTVWRSKDGCLINVYLSSTPIDPGDLSAGVVFTSLDVTEKKKAQDDLWRSEEKYRALFENAVMGIFQSTPEGRFLSVNPATAKMCGYGSPEEMVAGISDIATRHYVDPAERDLFIRAIEEQGFVRNFEHRSFRKDGSVFWVSVNARVIRDRRGIITHYEGTHEDIQGRKEAEEALRASEERFSKAFRSNPAPVAISTIDEGRFIEVNDRFLEAFGYRRDEIIGRTSADLDFWPSAESRDEVLKKLRETGSVKNVPNHYKTKSGQLRTGLWSGDIIRLGDRDALLSILHDITERKSAEEKYQSILADIEEIYYETDFRGNLTFFNDAACNIIGYTREELQGKNNRDYTTPETAERMYRAFNSVYRTGEKRRINNYEVIRKDGSRRVLEISVTLKRDERGSPDGFRGLGRDVTDRVKAEEALRLSEERYRAIFDNSLVGIFQSTSEGRYIRVNPAFARLYGYESPEDAVSSITDIGTQVFVDAEDRKRCMAILRETGTLERFETRTRRKDGSMIWTVINSRIVRDPDGRTLFIEGVIEDITERKNAAEALRASEERFIKVFQSNPIPMTIATIDEGRLIDVNERAIELSGYSREEMVGRSAIEIGLWAYPQERDRLIAILRETGSLRDGMAHFKTRAGDVKAALWSADVVQLGEKKVLLTTIHDISQQVEAQENLRQSEEKFRLLAENVTDVIWTADLNLTFTYVSPSSERVFGWSPSEWMSFTMQDYLPPASLERARAVLEKERKRPFTPEAGESRVITVEIELYRKDGSTCWCEVSARVVRDGDGKPISVTGVSRDIDARKKAEEALRKSEKKYRQIIETCPIGIAICDLDGRFIDANRSYLEMTGYGLDTLRGKRYDEITPSEYHETERNVVSMLTRSRTFTYDKEYLKEDGTRFPVSVTAWYATDAQGEKERLGAFVMDLTDRAQQEKARQELERQLRQAQKMEAVGTLAGGIAHDFNNILFAVIGYAELCLQDIHDEESRWNLSQILSACSRAKTLVNQILAFSRQVEQERKPLDVVPLAKEAVKFLRSSLPSTIDLSLDFDVTNSVILGDATQIHQVLMNLCTNAAHAMRASGGRLRILIDNAVPPAGLLPDETDGIRPEGFLHLGVSDTGQGIEPAQLNRIFDPFFTTKAPGEGTGLGLSVVYGIVKSLGGAIGVDSTPGRGSTFDIYLPSVAARGQEPERPVDPIPRGTESVLFVDDEGHLVEVMGQVLSALGYRVTTVRESRNALRLFRENPESFDIVITDMTMPDMTGAELAREILRLRPDTPIILCTGYSELIGEEEALKMGIRRFLMKPLFMGDVAREIRAVLAEHGRSPARAESNP